jgi:DNA-binding transcriptional LysR family regulator
MDWEDLRHFTAFVAAGSLSGAARQLGVEHATVARRIAALEQRLSLKLVDRRGRRLMLTIDGEQIAAVARRMEADVRAIDRIASSARSELTGDVTISAPSAYAATVLAAPLVMLRRRHPTLRIHLLGEARAVSLERREADIAIRLSRPVVGDLTVIKIGEMPFRLYASPAYLAVTPQSEWCFIGSDGPMAGSPQQAMMEQIAADDGFGFYSDHVEIQRALGLADGGIVVLPEFMVPGGVGLVPVLGDDPLLVRDIWLVVHSDMKAAASVRAVIECLRS